MSTILGRPDRAGIRPREHAGRCCSPAVGPHVRLTWVKPEHLPLLNSVSPPAVHPDGSRAVVSVTRPDFDADAYVGQLWNVPLDQEQLPRRITRGFRDSAPAFSPDGLALAFLRVDGTVVESAAVCGGGRRRRTAGHYRPAPRRRGFCLVSRFPPDCLQLPRTGRRPLRHQGETSTRTQRIRGWSPTTSTGSTAWATPATNLPQLFVLDVPEFGEEPRWFPAAVRSGPPPPATFPARQLTSAATDHESAGPSVLTAPAVYFVAAPPGSDDALDTGIYRVPAGGGEPLRVEPAGAPRAVRPGRPAVQGRQMAVLHCPGTRRIRQGLCGPQRRAVLHARRRRRAGCAD